MTTNQIYHVDFNQSKKTNAFYYAGGQFLLQSDGVFYIKKDKDANDLPPLWICSSLYVTSKTRDEDSGEWGRLLTWRDDDGTKHIWAMPLALLQGDSIEVRRELASSGLNISPNKIARELLSTYIQAFPVEERAICVKKLGWHENSFVREKEIIGESPQKIVFQNENNLQSAISVSGSLDDWKSSVARLSQGNTRLVFSLSLAFASTLLKLVHEDSGGFHFRGASSSGKTTALNVSASVWGKPKKYIRLWRSTANALEGLASVHNDGLLILDEISQLDPKQAGESAYLLANGQGKNRANKSGFAKKPSAWSLFFLSSGEESLSSLIAKGGQKATAGQEIRFADIEADALSDMGLFENIHEYPHPAAFAMGIKQVSNQYYGAVGLEWIKKIVKNQDRIKGYLLKVMAHFIDSMTHHQHSGQIKRVARRFALVYAAGKLATQFGLTGWDKKESLLAAESCFKAWLDDFGSNGNKEDRAILSQVKAFFESYGSSRFESINDPNTARISNRAGFYRTDSQGFREYIVLSSSYRNEICQGYDIKMVNRVLKEAGWIVPGNDGRSNQKIRIKGVGIPRCYVFTKRIWRDEPDSILL